MRREACTRAISVLDGLQSHWTPRPGPGLHTLGCAAYMDAPDPGLIQRLDLKVDAQDDYVLRSERLNTMLSQHFSWIYDALRAGLSKALGEPVDFCRGRALPGFHIFASHPVYETRSEPSHHVHVDRPYRGLDWSAFGEIDFSRTISFTLPLQLPSTGTGLRVWDVEFGPESMTVEETRNALSRSASALHTYVPGRLIVHSGHAPHRIEPWGYVEGERRITMQGHGLFFDGGWKIYF